MLRCHGAGGLFLDGLLLCVRNTGSRSTQAPLAAPSLTRGLTVTQRYIRADLSYSNISPTASGVPFKVLKTMGHRMF